MVPVELLRNELQCHRTFDPNIRQNSQHRQATFLNPQLRGSENKVATGQSLQHLSLAGSQRTHLVERNELAHAGDVLDELIAVLRNLVLEAV